jgi:hypothetical protein
MIMIGDTLQIFVSMIIYMAVVIGIGLYFAKRAIRQFFPQIFEYMPF